MVFLVRLSFFVLGTIIASFMGVVSGRLYTGQSFVTGRSKCDVCARPLSSLALVPIVAYLISRGRSVCCGARISPISPLTEAVLGVLFVATYVQVGFSPALPFILATLSVLLALVLYDLAHQILPPPLLTIFVALSALDRFLLAPSYADFLTSGVTALCIGGSLALVHFISRGRAMGLADAPLAFGLALLTGPVAFSGFVFSFWIGAAIGIVLLLQRPLGSRMRVEVPFAPFLAVGFLLAYFTQWNLFALITAASLW